MDKLEEIFEFQKELQERLDVPKRISDDSMKQQYINQMALAIYEETTEALRCTCYKDPKYSTFGWKKDQDFHNEKFKEEIVDIMHFVVNLALVAGMTSTDLHDKYLEKNKENHRRIDNGQRY